MKIYNNYKNYILPKKVQESLDKYKKTRNFSVENYVQDKINILNLKYKKVEDQINEILLENDFIFKNEYYYYD